MATVVSFINFKGGVGKTTLCVEIGAALASDRYKERVLLVDLDPQTNATLSLMNEDSWVEHSKSHGTLREFFDACFDKQDFPLHGIVVSSPVPHPQLKNLDLIPSHIELFGMDLRLATKFGHDNLQAKLFLKKALLPLQSEYTYILIDCPPNLYLATQNGLFASDNYVIVALPEYLSTLGVAHIQRSVGEIFKDARRFASDIGGSPQEFHPPEPIGIIFNRLRTQYGGTYSQEDVMRRISEAYPELVFRTKVPQSDRIATRAEVKVPIAVSGYAVDSVYEQRIAEVAEEFYDRLTTPATRSRG